MALGAFALSRSRRCVWERRRGRRGRELRGGLARLGLSELLELLPESEILTALHSGQHAHFMTHKKSTKICRQNNFSLVSKLKNLNFRAILMYDKFGII